MLRGAHDFDRLGAVPSDLPRVLTPPLARRFAVSRSRLRTEVRHGRWHRIGCGAVLTRDETPTREDWADLGVHLAGRGAALTGWDAACAHDLVSQRPPRLVVVLSRTAQNKVVGGVRVRRTTRDFDRRTIALGRPYELTPVVTVPRAIADTGLDVSRDALMALASRALQRGRCTLEDLRHEYDSGPRNGSAGLRRVLLDLAAGARSVAEATSARLLAAGPIPAFELNVPVVNEYGRLCFVLDQYWRELRAAVEIDSREHHFGEQDWHRTMARHNALTGAGVAVLHYPPAMITRPGSTYVAEVAAWLARRAAELGLPVPAGRGIRAPQPGCSPQPVVLSGLRGLERS